MKDKTMYHRILRVSSLVCALALLFESGMVHESTVLMSQNAHKYIASSVGASASVTPTELNKYTAALTAKERELDAREATLGEREIKVSLSSGSSAGGDTATYVLSSVLFILLVLILLNYVLDYLRIRDERESLPV